MRVLNAGGDKLWHTAYWAERSPHQPRATAMAQKSIFSFFGGPKSGAANPTIKYAVSSLTRLLSTPATPV